MNEKKFILGGAMLGVFLVLIFKNSVDVGLCSFDNYGCRESIDFVEHILYFAVPVFLFSLLTYKMKDTVFTSWWEFAKWSIPVIFFLLFLINLGLLHPGETAGAFGWGGLFDEAIDWYVSIALYVVFAIGSLVQIYRGYKKTS